MEDKISEVEGSLLPGFRFRPTDEELLNKYLKPKIEGPRDKHNDHMIREIDAYKLNPEQLPSIFFCRLKPKQSKSKHPCYNRKTSGGYWKVTSKDRPIMSKGTNEKIGFLKTLVFHGSNSGQNGSSNWVCHEYHLNHNEDKHYVVCRIKNKREKKPITALAPTISNEGCPSRPHACTSKVSGTPVNQEGDHSSFRNTLNSEVAGNQEAVNAQPETSAEELMESLPPILGLDETSPDNNNILLDQPHAEAGDGSSYTHDLPNYDGPILSPCSDPPNGLSFVASSDYNSPENYSSRGWESGTVPEYFSTPTGDNG